MEPLRTPTDALSHAIARVIWTGGTRRPKGRPGEIIEGLPEEARALLRGLKSSDISPDVISRDVAWLGQESEQHRMRDLIRTECLKFDRRLH